MESRRGDAARFLLLPLGEGRDGGKEGRKEGGGKREEGAWWMVKRGFTFNGHASSTHVHYFFFLERGNTFMMI